MDPKPDPRIQFLKSSRWATYITSGAHAIELLNLLEPDTSFLDDISDKELDHAYDVLGIPSFNEGLFDSLTPEDVRVEKLDALKESFRQAGFQQIIEYAKSLDIDETFSNQPSEDLHRLVRSIPVLKDTKIEVTAIPLAYNPIENTRVYYDESKEEFIRFGSVLLHARSLQGSDKLLKLNSIFLYCNWKPHGELGEMLVDRLFSHSDIKKHSDGVYALSADVTKGALLKLVLLMKSGTVLESWAHEPRWRLLSMRELSASKDNIELEKELERKKLELLPPTVQNKIIFDSLRAL